MITFYDFDEAVNWAVENKLTTCKLVNFNFWVFAKHTTIRYCGKFDDYHNGQRLLSVDICLKKPIEEILGIHYNSFERIIDEYNISYDDEITSNGRFPYHFVMIPSAYMADLMGSLEIAEMPDTQLEKPNQVAPQTEKVEFDQPMERLIATALTSGCAVMDMTDMSIYSL